MAAPAGTISDIGLVDPGVATPNALTLTAEGAYADATTGRADGGTDRKEKKMADTGGVLDDLVSGFAGVAKSVLSPDTEVGILQRVVDTAAATIEGCDFAGVFVLDEHGVTTSSHSDPAVIEIDAIQHRSAEGPCLDALSTGAAMYAGTLPTTPATRRSALKQQLRAFGARSPSQCASTGCAVRSTCTPGCPFAYGVTDRGKGVILATLAGVALTSVAQRHDMEQRNVNLQQAMLYREVIGQAQGILIERRTHHRRPGVRHSAQSLATSQREAPRRSPNARRDGTGT